MSNTNLLSSSCLFRLSTQHPGISQRPAVSVGQSQGMTHRPPGFTKYQFKLLQMEIGALNQGLSRTQLAPDRLSVALSVMLTKQVCNILCKCTSWVCVQSQLILGSKSSFYNIKCKSVSESIDNNAWLVETQIDVLF